MLAAYVVLASKNAYCPLHGRPSQFSIAADRWTADICRNVSLGVQFTSTLGYRAFLVPMLQIARSRTSEISLIQDQFRKAATANKLRNAPSLALSGFGTSARTLRCVSSMVEQFNMTLFPICTHLHRAMKA